MSSFSRQALVQARARARVGALTGDPIQAAAYLPVVILLGGAAVAFGAFHSTGVAVVLGGLGIFMLASNLSNT